MAGDLLFRTEFLKRQLAELEGRYMDTVNPAMKIGDDWQHVFISKQARSPHHPDFDGAMETLWLFMKAWRQSELGEWDEDFPSTLGPVEEYHATMDLPGVMSEGIQPPISRRSRHHYPQEMRASPPERATFSTPDREAAEQFLARRLEQTGTDPSRAGIVGIRSAGLPSPATQVESGFGGKDMLTHVRAGGIPRSRLVGIKKHATSPEAKRHKSEYDSKYGSTPERKKYHAELNRERRKRGIYGRGGPDMSHTKEGTIVPEDPHANRARHFKERGTLK